MEILVFVGLISVFVVLTLAVPDVFINPAAYFQAPAGIMVIGGVASLFMIGSTWDDIKGVFAAVKTLFQKR